MPSLPENTGEAILPSGLERHFASAPIGEEKEQENMRMERKEAKTSDPCGGDIRVVAAVTRMRGNMEEKESGIYFLLERD